MTPTLSLPASALADYPELQASAKPAVPMDWAERAVRELRSYGHCRSALRIFTNE